MRFTRLVEFGKLLFFGSVVLGMSAPASANNVQAKLEGELVTVFGDGAANEIHVSQNAADDVIVRGGNGTTVNGLTFVRFRNVSLNAMEIRMGGGNDIVTISNLDVANDLYINLGNDADRVLTGALPSAIDANLQIEGGSGNEVVRLTDWSVFGDLYIDGQTGGLNAALTRLDVVFKLTVIGDDVNDVVDVAECLVGDSTSIETKKGADRVTVSDFAGFNLFVNSDMGGDVIEFTNIETLEDIGVFTGTQSDRVTFTDVASGKNIVVSLDLGNDSFLGTNVSAEFDAVFEGGDGLDTFGDFGVVGGEKTEIKEFEIFP